MKLEFIDELTEPISELAFLALMIWREARGASHDGQVAVGYTVINRVGRPSWWGKTLDQVLFKLYQYSSMAAPGDPQLINYPRLTDPSWRECLHVANAVLSGEPVVQFPGADSYHDSSIPTPPRMATGRYCGEIVSPQGLSLKFFDVDHDYEAHALVAKDVAAGGTPDIADPFTKSLHDFLVAA